MIAETILGPFLDCACEACSLREQHQRRLRIALGCIAQVCQLLSHGLGCPRFRHSGDSKGTLDIPNRQAHRGVGRHDDVEHIAKKTFRIDQSGQRVGSYNGITLSFDHKLRMHGIGPGLQDST